MSYKKDRNLKDWSGTFSPPNQDGKLRVPFREVGNRYSLEEVQAVVEAMQTDILTQGPYLKKFQEEFAEYIGTKYAFGVSSCTAALEIATQLIGIKPGDEVIVPAITFISTVIPILRQGARPVFADIDPFTYNITAETIKEKITSRTKAIYVVHLAGLPADMDPIMDLAQKYNLTVLEDCAHAPGATYKGKKVGSIGKYGCFSFHTVKNMTTLGEGGMLTTNDDESAKDIPPLRWVGMKPFENQKRYWIPFIYDIVKVRGCIPFNFCMGEIQAAVGRVQLKKLDKMNERRRELAHRLSEGLKDMEEFTVPKEPEYAKHVYHLYPLLFNGEKFGATREDFMDMVYKDYGIKTVPHYLPVYLFSMFREMGYKPGECPGAEKIYSKLTNPPFNLLVSDEDIDYMIDSFKEAVKRLKRGERAKVD